MALINLIADPTIPARVHVHCAFRFALIVGCTTVPGIILCLTKTLGRRVHAWFMFPSANCTFVTGL